jgi:hypothetical protein
MYVVWCQSRNPHVLEEGHIIIILNICNNNKSSTETKHFGFYTL